MVKVLSFVLLLLHQSFAGFPSISRLDRRVTDTPMVGILVPESPVWQFSRVLVEPAVELALEKIRKDPRFLPAVRNMTALPPEDSKCTDMAYASYKAIEMYMSKPVTLYLGPVCDFVAAQMARLMSYFNMPLILPGALHFDFTKSRLDSYNTTTRMTPAETGDFISMLMAIYKRYNWSQGSTIYTLETQGEVMPRLCYFVADGLANYGRVYTGKPFPYSSANTRKIVPFNQGGAAEYEDVLRTNVGSSHAVVVLCADPDSVRQIMKTAFDLNFINGEYVFFNVDLFSNRTQTLRPWYRANDTKEGNEKARKAYRALLTVTLRKPDSEEYKNFSMKVKDLAAKRFNFTSYGEEEVNSFVGAFHDAVLLYAIALNETLAANQSISDGLYITRKMWDRKFTGITGNISINERGDRNADYSLLDMNKENGDFEVVANYFGNEQKYEAVKGKKIDWGTDDPGPPPDTPKCGFDNSGCPRNQMSAAVISALVMAGLIAVALVVGLFVYRRMKFQAQLQAMNWIIEWEELTTKRHKPQRQSKKSGTRFFGLERDSSHENHSLLGEDRDSMKRKSTACSGKNSSEALSLHSFFGSDLSLETIAGIQLNQLLTVQTFTRTAFYRGNIVALKKINIRGRRLDFRRTDLLKDVKKVKDLSSDHVTRFIGACLDAPNECIITEYCPKGSLQDVLENDSINLDWMFRVSLMQDICRGMIYLQNNIGAIGNLKSSNCLVDSRFVLKITDFGLRALRGPPDISPVEEPYRYYRNLLWTAPELLRQINDERPESTAHLATVKGDVYSFGIVAQEVIMRKGVFYLGEDQMPEPRTLIQRLRSEEAAVPLRPLLDPDEGCSDQIVDVVRSAWEENPLERPNFTQIKIAMKKMNKGGDSGNILDNLLSRMEQYAHNLEGLVQQRTEAYLEEKKKAEDLLYSMLPKSVAGQLIRGVPVTAESYESVTIYFSDICGFTSLSAESTPIQIVQMLNDLYTLFDSIIENYDAYKVETIGDAYMVVSGLPQRNGNLHAREVARMSLAFLKHIFRFRIRHKPEKQLKLRIGLHSGPVCAGVVGLKMPRYCLFGDTVNTTSRLESTGLPLKIHMSGATKEVLDTFENFIISRRGMVAMKGKADQLTYWLHGENGEIVDPISPSSSFQQPE